MKVDDLMAANERPLIMLQSDAEHQATLLRLMMYEKKVLIEGHSLHHLLETDGISLINLRNYRRARRVEEKRRSGLVLGRVDGAV